MLGLIFRQYGNFEAPKSLIFHSVKYNQLSICPFVSPLLSIVIGVHVVSHLHLEDGTVLSDAEHGELVTHALVLGLGREDLLGEGPHVVVGLCRLHSRGLMSSRAAMHSVSHLVGVQDQSENTLRQTARLSTQSGTSTLRDCYVQVHSG